MKIGIIGAMAVEVETLKEHLQLERKVTHASMEFFEGKLSGVDVVIVQSGVAKVSAAMCVQVLVDVFNVTHIINTGVAGSLDADIDIGDLVVSTSAVYHDVDACIFGYSPGEVPQLGVKEFPADEHMADVVIETAQEVAPDIKEFKGRVCSGDQFIADDDKKAWIKKTFDGLCTEMEGAGIAQASYINGIPFVIIRAISDKADGSGSVDYPTFEAKAAHDCAAITEAAIARL